MQSAILFSLLIVVCLFVIQSKGRKEEYYVMDEKDTIIGVTQLESKAWPSSRRAGGQKASYQEVGQSEEAPAVPTPPLQTSDKIQQAAQRMFPPGTLNMTVDKPWIKKGSICNIAHSDAHIVHHFEDTAFVPSNDVCALPVGAYTWTLTADYQLSFGRYPNNIEFGTKHANLALARPVYVAGELAVLSGTSNARGQLLWNLLSGTFSLPMSASVNASDPLAYLENVMAPAMSQVWAAALCYPLMHYQNAEFFPELLPSSPYIADICANDYYALYDDALTWLAPPSVNSSVCQHWDDETCLLRYAASSSTK